MKSVKRLVDIALCCALLVISKEVLAFLPNIELVTFLLICFSLHFDLMSSLLIATGFCFIQMVLYGIGPWTPMYFIVWNLLVLLTKGCRRWIYDVHYWALFSGAFGLVFGFLFSVPYFIIDWNFGMIYFLKGIPFDLIHGVGNYLIMMILFEKCNDSLKRILK